MARRYATSGQDSNTASETIIELRSTTAIRPKIYDLTCGSDATQQELKEMKRRRDEAVEILKLVGPEGAFLTFAPLLEDLPRCLAEIERLRNNLREIDKWTRRCQDRVCANNCHPDTAYGHWNGCTFLNEILHYTQIWPTAASCGGTLPPGVGPCRSADSVCPELAGTPGSETPRPAVMRRRDVLIRSCLVTVRR